MNVVFRVDASNQIGSGHIMRCLTLACELAGKGAQCHFICAELPGNMIDYLNSKGFPVHVIFCPELAEDEAENKKFDHLQLLRDKKLTDAGETIKIIENIIAGKDYVDLLIVDHYSLDREWEQLLRACAGKIMVIDDTADRAHDCDILLDQNLYENMEARYEGLVPDTCIKLLGPQYALLRPEFREARKSLRQRDGTVNRILVFMGGADPTNETAKALEAIKMLNRPEIVTDVVVGSSNSHRTEIKAMCDNMPNTNFYCQVENMAELMVKADLAIGGGGSTTWERCCLGLPVIIITIANNQIEPSLHLLKIGAILDLIQPDISDRTDLTKVLANCTNKPNHVAEVGNKAYDIMNKAENAIHEAISTIMRTSSSCISNLYSLRSITELDSLKVFNWRNSEHVRSKMLTNKPIDAKDHQKWFRKIIKSKTDLYLVFEKNSEPIGLSYFNNINVKLKFCMWGFYLGQPNRVPGTGSILAKLSVDFAKNTINMDYIYGIVLPYNKPSIRIFEKMGFHRITNTVNHLPADYFSSDLIVFEKRLCP